MPRYIDADRLDEIVQDLNEHYEVPITRYEYKRISGVLFEFPTADVRKNVHGEWLKSNESALRPYMCSNCGCLYDVDTVMGKIVWNYCPNCGAVMDESEEPTMEEYMYRQEGSEEDGSL